MKIIFYCQYVWGVGHLFRSLELVRALVGHEVVLVAGGRQIDIQLPEHVSLVHLPGLYMDEEFTTLIPEEAGQSLEAVQRARKKILFSLFEQHRPGVFMIELYPFGRRIFGFELQPLLAEVCQGRFGALKVVCSLRDILVEKKDPRAYEARVLKALNTYFDLLLIHADDRLLTLDQTFSRVNDIRIPAVYTGFVAQKVSPHAGIQLRRELGVGSQQKLIVVSAGGGRSGYTLLSNVLEAHHLLADSDQIRLEMFAGPFRDPEEYKALVARSAAGVRVQYFTNRFLDYLSAADLSISLAGYNTCMNLMVTGVPALVFPYSKQQEQPLRVEKIKKFIPMKILGVKDLEPVLLSSYIQKQLTVSRPTERVSINLDGAENAASYLHQWIGDPSK